ncbi:MAG: sulfurtransferase TusA family protein [Gammaproteobacteria bacterium]|nr:sulfurtransferase TusA family protein [Gammaproteobacteria bacterium]
MSTQQHVLDAKGLNCPLPILRAKKAIAAMNSGEMLKITATDPGSVKDFESFCKQTGNELVHSQDAGDHFEFEIRKH